MSRWFRHYAGMMRDDKLVRVALKSGQTVERVCWVYGAILESAAEMNDDGRYDFDVDEAAYFLRADAADVAAIVSCLESCGRIDGGFVVRWTERQFKSDTSAERVRRHRERQKRNGNGDEEARTDATKRDRNYDVTLQQRFGNGPETETETETEISLGKPSDIQRAAVSRETPSADEKPKPTPMTDDFEPPEEWISEGADKGKLTMEEAKDEWDEFKGYWLERAGERKNGRKKDWRRTWINYVTGDICQRRVASRRRNSGGSNGSGGQSSRYERFLRRHSVPSPDDPGDGRTAGGDPRVIEGGCAVRA